MLRQPEVEIVIDMNAFLLIVWTRCYIQCIDFPGRQAIMHYNDDVRKLLVSSFHD